MLKGVVMKGLGWEMYEALLWHSVSSSKGVYYMISDMSGEERSGEGLNCIASDMKCQGV